MPNVKRQNTCDRAKDLVQKGILKELRYQSPALATLIYVDLVADRSMVRRERYRL